MNKEWLDARFGYNDYLKLNRKWKLIHFESVAQEILEMLQLESQLQSIEEVIDRMVDER